MPVVRVISPSNRRLGLAVACIAMLGLAGCESASLTVGDGSGSDPKLPAPASSLLPTINIAKADGWTDGALPTPADDLSVRPFAAGLDHPRWLYRLPNGDILVAETNAPKRPDDGRGLRGWAMGLAMRRAGAGVPSPDRITLLRDADGDGLAELKTPFLENLHSPFGMALVGDTLYVANTEALLRFPYRSGDTRIAASGEKVADLPGGPLNHHWTKNVIASADGSRLYVTVGSNSNVAENGIDAETQRACILEIDPATGTTSIFASGLRNPNGLAWEPASGALWTAVNERDELGSDLVPDYMTRVQRGAFYGWPYSYYGQHLDVRVQPPRPELVATAVVPDYALGAHTASLGLAFNSQALLPAQYGGGAFIGQHGSWNRRPFSGYEVVFVPFADGRPSGPMKTVLSGFLDADGHARGRPVGVAFDQAGALLVADDVGNVIWRVAPKPN